MTSENTLRAITSLPAVIIALAILALWGISPETVIVLVVLWAAGVVLPRAWEFHNGKLSRRFLLQNLLLYTLFLMLIGAEYLTVEGTLHGISKEMVMFLTAWLLSGVFEFLWPGFARRESKDPTPPIETGEDGGAVPPETPEFFLP